MRRPQDWLKQVLYSDTLEKLSNRPRFKDFRLTIQRIIAERGDEIAFSGTLWLNGERNVVAL
ncbi:MAG: hypothetical protein KatS3mg022_1834 [Armatimonadota bacterium]|nr:MAG: hypothetical protein KatS3mg022_1834 [Armatimonadota bacterium]